MATQKYLSPPIPVPFDSFINSSVFNGFINREGNKKSIFSL